VAQQLRERMDKWNYMKLKSFCTKHYSDAYRICKAIFACFILFPITKHETEMVCKKKKLRKKCVPTVIVLETVLLNG
jgi:hypothetical protein